MTLAQKPQPLPSGRGWGQCQKSLPFGIPHGLHPTHLMHRFVEDAVPYTNKPAAAFLRRSIGTIYEPTHITQYLFLWREAVFRHSLPFLLMQPRFGLLLPRNPPYAEAVHPPDQCRGNRYAPPEVLCGSISPHALRPPPV